MKRIGGGFVQQVRRDLTLNRELIYQERQTRNDRLRLTFSAWAHFFFNYSFSPRFDSFIKEACMPTETAEFRLVLLELFELHYLAALMSFNTSGFMDSEIQQRHFSDMQYGYLCLANAEGETPSEIIDNTLHEMLYYDIIYIWSTSPLFGPMSSYYSSKALLYQIKRQLEKP
jgi:hypothetical protein